MYQVMKAALNKNVFKNTKHLLESNMYRYLQRLVDELFMTV